MCERFEAMLPRNDSGLRNWLGNVVGRIISVTQVGDAAALQLSIDSVADESQSWIDFHNLQRIDGVRKITNKTATHSSR